MKFSAIFLFHICLLADRGAWCGPRARRSVGQFGDMIRQHVRREALLYNAYGNYCGATYDYTVQPVDEVDRCCLRHDLCYRSLKRNECSSTWLSIYIIRYTWSHSDRAVTCSDAPGTCSHSLCLCDKTAVECFASHRYNKQNKRSSIWDILA